MSERSFCRNTKLEIRTVLSLHINLLFCPPQILNRFLIERGRVTIPKSVHRERIKENFDILDFKFSDADLKELDALDKNLRYFQFEL